MKRSDINIMLVEDDKTFGRVLKEALSKTGMNVVHFTSPSEALSAAKLQNMHLAVVDCMLPKMNGIDLSIEMRNTQFDQNPIILMSGIFKEKAFENESLTKTGAVSFLHKPFELKQLEDLVTKSLGGLFESETWSLKSLLARRLRSVRDRMKIIESLESISGLDIPMVISILTDAKVSGHLNLVTPEGQIYGVTFSKGKISAFDSEKAEGIILNQLRASQFLSEEDWKEFLALGERRSVINKLINKGYVSPHAIHSAKTVQIREELSGLIKISQLQVSFVPDDSIDANGGLDFIDAYGAIYQQFLRHVDLPFFHALYQDYMDSPIRLTETGMQNEKIWEFEDVARIAGLKEKVSESNTLAETLSGVSHDELKVFTAIHSLVVNRIILFDDLQKTRSAEASLERLKKLKRDLTNLNALELFNYFGASAKATDLEVNRIYKSFQATNHPDQLKDATKESRQIAEEVFKVVTEAFETLTDQTKRALFFDSLKEKQNEREAEAGVLYEQAMTALRKGQSQQAFDLSSKAYALNPSSRYFFITVWSELKSKSGQESQSRLVELMQKLDTSSAEERKDPYYWMAAGLVKRASGDPTAFSFFEKALALDSSFVEARREMNAMQVQSAQAKSNKTMDFLKGDITELVSQIFKKKSG